MFVRDKGGKYYLVESVRKDDRVEQRVLAYLGEYPTVQAAIKGLSAKIKELRAKAAKDSREAQKYQAQLAKDGLLPRGKMFPRSHGHGSGYTNHMTSRYWFFKDNADTASRRADRLEARLKKLRAL